jgi:hypothetical protein
MLERRLELFALLVLVGCGSPGSVRAPDGGEGARDAAPPSPDGAAGAGGGLGAAELGPDELDAPSRGGTITFQSIGAAGWYPSRRDPALASCDVYQTDACCLARHEVTSDALTPWDEDLVLTLRGPLRVKQLAVYQPEGAASAEGWALVSAWDARDPAGARGSSFRGDGVEGGAFAGAVGTECLVDVATSEVFPCGAGSEPYCPPSPEPRHLGWSGSKLFVLLATMPHAGEGVGTPCSEGTGGNWYDAPWIGLSLGELARAGAFSDCQCYAKDPAEWYLGDGCGQFNVFEVVNDNNEYRNLDVFSTNFFGYGGYVGEGPCGGACDVSGLDAAVDLIDKANDTEAAAGGVAGPAPIGGPGVAFRRPASGYRYFLILLDVPTRTVQLAMVHPAQIPAALAPLLPGLPAAIEDETVRALIDLRLPH